MTTIDTRGLDPNDCDCTSTDPRRDLGVDGEGHSHHQRGDLVVRVAPDGALERVTPLGAAHAGTRGDALDNYVHEFVGEQVGWAVRWQATDRDVFGPRDGDGDADNSAAPAPDRGDRGDRIATDGGEDVRISDGEKVVAKLKRGTGTRDQDSLKLVGRGATADEAAADFEALLCHAEEHGWTDRLRALQPEEEATDE